MKEPKTLGQLHREKEWDMGQARTCLICGDVLLTKKNLRIHRAKHRNKLAFTPTNKMEVTCEKTVTT